MKGFFRGKHGVRVFRPHEVDSSKARKMQGDGLLGTQPCRFVWK